MLSGKVGIFVRNLVFVQNLELYQPKNSLQICYFFDGFLLLEKSVFEQSFSQIYFETLFERKHFFAKTKTKFFSYENGNLSGQTDKYL
jgi:hypothetical protein